MKLYLLPLLIAAYASSINAMDDNAQFNNDKPNSNVRDRTAQIQRTRDPFLNRQQTARTEYDSDSDTELDEVDIENIRHSENLRRTDR